MDVKRSRFFTKFIHYSSQKKMQDT